MGSVVPITCPVIVVSGFGVDFDVGGITATRSEFTPVRPGIPTTGFSVGASTCPRAAFAGAGPIVITAGPGEGGVEVTAWRSTVGGVGPRERRGETLSFRVVVRAADVLLAAPAGSGGSLHLAAAPAVSDGSLNLAEISADSKLPEGSKPLRPVCSSAWCSRIILVSPRMLLLSMNNALAKPLSVHVSEVSSLSSYPAPGAPVSSDLPASHLMAVSASSTPSTETGMGSGRRTANVRAAKF